MRDVACVGLSGAYNEKFFKRNFEAATGTPWSTSSSLQYAAPKAVTDSEGHRKTVEDALAFEEFARSDSGYGTYFGPLKSFIEQCGFRWMFFIWMFF